MSVGVHHGATFNFGSAKVCSPAIFETYLSYTKDIWIAATDYQSINQSVVQVLNLHICGF